MALKIVIVGGVAGGMSAAARLRRISEDATIVVFEKGEYVSYANCGLPYYAGEIIKNKQDLLVQTPKSLHRRFNIDVRVLHEVVRVDALKKIVEVKNIVAGKVYAEAYDKLILSCGAEPFRPELPGINSEKIFTMRTIPDTDKIKEFISREHPGHVLIVGAGYIGLEMAENFRNQGLFVTIVEMAGQVISAVDFEVAAMVHKYLKDKKIELYLNEAVEVFEDTGKQIKARLKSGREIKADMVLLSIGVKPDVSLAKSAGLKLGDKGGIAVNEYLQTADPSIYAVGDAIEVVHGATGAKAVIPLAGPANKQGRIAADNCIFGNKKKYERTFGTAIAKIFDMTVGVTGATERLLMKEKIPHESVIIHPVSHASYYPDPKSMTLKVLFSPSDGRILGAQCLGYEGVDKRIDVIAAAMFFHGTVYDLTAIEHSYAPPYSSAKDPVNMAGFSAENILSGKIKPVHWNEIPLLDPEKTVLVDVRTPEEYAAGTIPGAILIPVDALRENISQLPKNKEIVVFCRVGLRGYIAGRILLQNGFRSVRNLSGGYLTYAAAAQKQDNRGIFDESYDTGMHE